MESQVDRLEKELKETRQRLAAAKEQLRLQSRRARQLVAACSTKVAEKEREMQMLRVLKDGQLQSIIRKLLHFESLLRQEQKRIMETVQTKDGIIAQQALELEQLRQQNRKLLMAAAKDDVPADNTAVKVAKLHSGSVKCNTLEQQEDKENEVRPSPSHQPTPLVTKMVRRFELPVTKPLTMTTSASSVTFKPEVPKKPARLVKSCSWKTEINGALGASGNVNQGTDSGTESASGSSGTEFKSSPSLLRSMDSTYRSDNNNEIQRNNNSNLNAVAAGGAAKGVVRADSFVNDHGYFTLEKRKPLKMSPVAAVNETILSPSACSQHNSSSSSGNSSCASGNNNKMDLSDNFEEFHLMDSLEEEELHLYEISQQSPCSQVPSHQMHAADYGPSVKMDTSSPPPLIPAGKKSAVKALKRTPERHHHQRAVTHHQTDNQFQDRSSGDWAEWSQSFDRVQTPPPTDCTAISMSSSMILPQLGDSTPTAVQFDRFLDVSGLMTKSILTPSRLLSNHKNMLKPKDVKHRSKVKAVLGSCRLNSTSVDSIHDQTTSSLHQSTNQVRYYVEPFL